MLNNPLQLIGMLRNSQDPMALAQQMLGSHPQFQPILQMIKGKSPQELEQYVRNLYQSQGQDINQKANQFGLKL